jgi:hypothetical protein
MKTNADLLTLVQFLNESVGEGKTKGQKKLIKIGERIKSLLDEFNEKKEELRLDNASVDKDGNLLLNEKGEYSFNKEGIKKLNSQLKDLLLSEINVEPIQVINPEGLESYPFLNGWVKGVEFKKVDLEEIEL